MRENSTLRSVGAGAGDRPWRPWGAEQSASLPRPQPDAADTAKRLRTAAIDLFYSGRWFDAGTKQAALRASGQRFGRACRPGREPRLAALITSRPDANPNWRNYATLRLLACDIAGLRHLHVAVNPPRAGDAPRLGSVSLTRIENNGRAVDITQLKIGPRVRVLSSPSS